MFSLWVLIDLLLGMSGLRHVWGHLAASIWPPRGIGQWQANESRMNQTMTRLQKMTEAEYSTFLRTVFGLTSPSPVEEVKVGPGGIEWVDEGLNESQKEAIRFALGSREVALIHGPPGVSYPLRSDAGC
jgi:hypothetical protein